MRMRPTHGAAVVFAATLAVTVGSPGPAEAFFFLPIFQQQSQPSIDSKSGRSPSDNNRWRERQGEGRGRRAQAVHRHAREARRGEIELQLLGQERKVASEIRGEIRGDSSQAPRTRSVRQEPPPSKSSGRASASVRRESPASGGSTPPAAPPAPPTDSSANATAQTPSSARAGSTLGDTFDEKLGEVFKARIDELLKQSN